MESNNSRSFFGDFKKYLPLLQNLAGKDFKLKYRRSILGIAWSILNPLLTMLVLTVVFGYLFGIGRGTYADVPDFAVFYIVGASMWNFFSEATTGSMTSVTAAASLIKKVYIPKYIFPLEKCLFALINFAFSLIAVAIVMIARSQFPGITLVMLPVPVIYCLLFATGISLFLSAVTVYFNDVIHLYSVVLTLWLYLTTLIYPLSLVETWKGESFIMTVVVTVIKYNPMSMYLTMFRDVVMNNTWPSLEQHLWCFGYGILMMVIGIFTFKKLQKNFILNI